MAGKRRVCRARSAGLPGPYGLSAHAADVTALLDRLGADGEAGADATVLVGHSMGGFVAALPPPGRPGTWSTGW